MSHYKHLRSSYSTYESGCDETFADLSLIDNDSPQQDAELKQDIEPRAIQHPNYSDRSQEPVLQAVEKVSDKQFRDTDKQLKHLKAIVKTIKDESAHQSRESTKRYNECKLALSVVTIIVVVLFALMMAVSYKQHADFMATNKNQMQQFKEMHAEQIATNKNIISSIDSNTAQLQQMNDSIKYLYSELHVQKEELHVQKEEMHVQKEKYAALELQQNESFMELVKYF